MSKQDIPIIGPLLNRIIGSRNERFVKKYTQRTQAINALDGRVRQMSDEQIRSYVESHASLSPNELHDFGYTLAQAAQAGAQE